MNALVGRLHGGVTAVDQRWRAAGIRTRLTAAAALAATFAIVAVVAVAYIAVHHELYSNIDGQLRRQANSPHQIRLNELGQPRVYKDPDVSAGNVQVVDVNGGTVTEPGGFALPVSQRDQDIAANGGSWLRTQSVQGKSMRILTVRRVGQLNTGEQVSVALQVALPLTAANSELHKLRIAFLLLVVLGFLMAMIGTRFMVRRTMRPVARLTSAAEQIAVTRDLTTRIEEYGADELGRLASTFNSMLDALERSLDQQRQLILDASHELRTPLASLRTNVEVLHDVDRLSLEQRRSLLNGVVAQLDELTGLVADVVELARGDVPETSLEDVALEDLVSHEVDRARRHWPSIVYRYSGAPVTVRGVPARLSRAVANVLDNAGKFSPAGSEVDVELTAGGVLTVADHGPGIPEAALEHVFNRFYRADEARALPGSGLGLSIVKQVVDGHNGTVSIRNRSGGGTGAIVRVALPPAGLPPPEPSQVDGRKVAEPVL